jgi:hypothetical protein
MEKSAKDTKPPSKMYSSHIFWKLEKDGRLREHNPCAEEVRGLEVFFIKLMRPLNTD